MKDKPSLRISDRHRIATKADGTRMPVIDSKFTFLLQPTADDIKNGIPGDHTNCMYCLACRRQFNSDLVWVTRGLAYVELKGKGGKSELHRFILSDPARMNVKDFDNGKDITSEAVIFAAPKGGQRLDAQRLKYYASKNSSNQKKKAYVSGTVKGHHRPKPIAQVLRDPATGMFHFARV